MDESSKNKLSKTIATIDVNVNWPKVERQAWLEESICDHFQCVLCGEDLAFQHKTDFVELTVAEEAHCPRCNIRNRQEVYKLQ